MGTGAFMTLNNRTGYDLTCSVSNIVCMYQDGNEGSHLERFNTHLANNDSLNHIYIEAKAAVFSDCASKQSCFTLNFSGNGIGDESIGSLMINLGSHSFNTSVVHNTNKAMLKVDIQSGDQYTINIDVVQMPLPVSLVNSFFWSNRDVIEKVLQLPPQENSQFKISAAAFSGLSTLVCTDASVSGSYENGTLLTITAEANQLFSHCELTIKLLNNLTVSTGIIIKDPKLLINGSMTVSTEGIQLSATKISLTSGKVSIPGTGLIPEAILTLLFNWFESIIEIPAVQQLILSKINDQIPKIHV